MSNADTEEPPTSSNGTKIVLLSVAAFGVAALLYALKPSADPPVETKPIETVVEKKPEPPPPVPAPVVENKPEPVKDEIVDKDAMRDSLLGTNKKPKEGIAEMAQRSKEKRTNVRTRKRPQPEDQAQDEFVDKMATTGGGLSDAAFYATMDKWRGAKSCLATATTRNDEVKGTPKGALRISLKIGGNGEVLDSRVFEPSNDVAKLIAPCVELAAKQIKFPAFEASAPVSKTAKFVF